MLDTRAPIAVSSQSCADRHGEEPRRVKERAVLTYRLPAKKRYQRNFHFLMPTGAL